MADIRTTTPNRLSRLALALVAVGMAAGLLVMAVPRLFAALYVLEASNTVQALRAGRPVNDAALDAALDSLDNAVAWHPDARSEAGRGLLLSARAMLAPTEVKRGEDLAQAEQTLVKSLVLTPAQGETWFRLAWLRNQAGNRPAAAEALRMSFLAAGFAPHLMVPRLELGLRLLPIMDAAEREILKRQIRLTWIASPDDLAELATRRGGSELVKAALDDLSEDEVARYVLARSAK